jgi:HK97 family phage prohead protease
MIERKTFDAQIKIKADGDGAGEISGYPSVFANWDAQGERVMRGAFAADLGDFLANGFVSVGHDWRSLPIAMPVEAYEDDHGLFARAVFHSTGEAQAARTVINERLANGKSVRLSIGYDVLADEWTSEGRLLKRLKLYEWSYVTVPANPLAAVTTAKSGPPVGLPFADHSETVLATVKEFQLRATRLYGLRAKEGRALSGANRERIASLLASLKGVSDDLEGLLRDTEPKDAAKARVAYAEFLKIQAQLNGVKTNA